MSTEKLKIAVRRLSTEQSYSAYAAAANLLDHMDPQASGLSLLKVAILRNFTLDPLIPVIKGELALSGFYPRVHLGGYDTIAQDVLDPQSELYTFGPDLIFVAQWLEVLAPALVNRFSSLPSDQINDQIEGVLVVISQFITALRRYTKAPIIINNFALPMFPALGILDIQSKSHQTQAFLKLNMELRDRLELFDDVYLMDLMSLMARVGSTQGIDERYWQVGRAPIGRPALIPWAQEYGKFVRALRGKARKCLVLDCDNVLWGGIVGEDGFKNIHLGKTYPGSSYQAFQNEILNLHDRGVILALCSKNNEADVLEVLKDHPDMILRENNFAARQINWDDKVTNLIRIAEDLNIILDSMVLVDDSPFECDLVREQLPQVAVLCLSSDPSLFRAKLQEQGFFDTLSLSQEDKQRNQMYRDESSRKHLMASVGSIEDYLANLEMVAEIGPADELTIPRIAQLTQKTNQFNLTTRRYTEADIHAFAHDPQVDVFYLKLADRISDMGLVGVVIVKYNDQKAEIDTFLLSCRVLGRGVDNALMEHVLTVAKDKGCEYVRGQYLATAKNGQVQDFYKRSGFQPVLDTEGRDYKLLLQQAIPAGPQWVKVNPIKKRSEHAV